MRVENEMWTPRATGRNDRSHLVDAGVDAGPFERLDDQLPHRRDVLV